MLTKAYVEEIVDEYRVKVRIPIFNGLSSSPNATPTEQLSISPICAIPGGKYNYSVGDIVFVTFEDNDLGRPVILGQLYADIDNQGLASLTLDSLTVKQSATLPSDTSIGNVSAESIKNLQGIRLPVQQQIDSLSGGVLGVGQNNPYMNTIVQNFMEAHYVVLPSGNYIVDSFKKSEVGSVYPSGEHYFYEFTKNTGTDTEETPIYNQSKLLYKITIGSQWSTALSNLPNETPIYVVFDKNENNNVYQASLYVQKSSTSAESQEQMLFSSLAGTEVEVALVNINAETEGQYLTKHGDKKFWDLLLTNFVSKYRICRIEDGLPSSPQKDITYFTQGRVVSGTYSGTDDFQFPWVYYESDQELVFSPTFPVLIGQNVRVYYEDGGQFSFDDLQVQEGTYNRKNYKYVIIGSGYQVKRVSQLDTSSPLSIPTGSVLFSMSSTGDGSWSVPVSYQIPIPDGYEDQTEYGQIGIDELVVSMVRQTFQSLSEKYTMSNVLQMAGVLSMQLCGINVRQLYGDLYSPRSSIDLEMKYGQSYSGQYGTALQAIDLMYPIIFGDDAEHPNGLDECGKILWSGSDDSFGYKYWWEDVLVQIYGTTSFVERSVLCRSRVLTTQNQNTQEDDLQNGQGGEGDTGNENIEEEVCPNCSTPLVNGSCPNTSCELCPNYDGDMPDPE